MRFDECLRIRSRAGSCYRRGSRRKMAKSQRASGQCSLAQAALSVGSGPGWKRQAGHALAVFEDSSTCSQCHGGAVGGGSGGGECGRVLRWRRRCCFFLFVIFFFAGGAPSAGCLRWAGRDMGRCDAAAIGVKVCVSRPCSPTHVAGRWVDGIYSLMLQDTVTATFLQREVNQLHELAFTARAVCCNLHRPHFCARQAYIISGVTDFTLRRRQPCRLATTKDTRATLPPETADRWVTSLHS